MYITEKEWDALHVASEQISELLHKGAEDIEYWGEIQDGLISLIRKANKERTRQAQTRFNRMVQKEVKRLKNERSKK